MQVSYCDLCGIPLKEGTYFMLYATKPQNITYDEIEGYYKQLKEVQKEVKEICPSCKYVFDEMFRLRLVNLSELVDEINLIYNLTSKKNPKERKNGKTEEK